MGSVYRARDLKTGQTVAVKFLNDRIVTMLCTQTSGEGTKEIGKLVQRFRREAGFHVGIRQVNIARGLDVIEMAIPGSELTVPVLIYEFIEGKSLADELYLLAEPLGLIYCVDGSYRFFTPEERPVELDHPLMPIRDIMTIFFEVLNGVTHLHTITGFDDGRSIIHRDLKPENIMLSRLPNGMPHGIKVVDLGVAGVSDALRLNSTNSGTRLTKETTVLGTPAYMPLQQFMEPNKPLPMFDTYALGVILFQALTGRLPYADLTAHQVVGQLVAAQQYYDPCKYARGIPASLQRIVLRATSRVMEGRPSQPDEGPYRNGSEMLCDLRKASYEFIPGSDNANTMSGAPTINASLGNMGAMRRVPQPSIPAPPRNPQMIVPPPSPPPQPVVASVQKSTTPGWLIILMVVLLISGATITMKVLTSKKTTSPSPDMVDRTAQSMNGANRPSSSGDANRSVQLEAVGALCDSAIRIQSTRPAEARRKIAEAKKMFPDVFLSSPKCRGL